MDIKAEPDWDDDEAEATVHVTESATTLRRQEDIDQLEVQVEDLLQKTRSLVESDAVPDSVACFESKNLGRNLRDLVDWRCEYCRTHGWHERVPLPEDAFDMVWNDFKAQHETDGAAQPVDWTSLAGKDRQKARKAQRSRFNAYLFQTYGNVHMARILLKFGCQDPDVVVDQLKTALQYRAVDEGNAMVERAGAEKDLRKAAQQARSWFRQGRSAAEKHGPATRAARDFLSGRAAEEVDAANERYGYGVMRGRPARTSYHSENPRSVLDYYDPSGASEPASEPASSSRKRRGAP